MKVWVVSSGLLAISAWLRCRRGEIWPAGGRRSAAGSLERARGGYREHFPSVHSSPGEAARLLARAGNLIAVTQRVQ